MRLFVKVIDSNINTILLNMLSCPEIGVFDNPSTPACRQGRSSGL